MPSSGSSSPAPSTCWRPTSSATSTCPGWPTPGLTSTEPARSPGVSGRSRLSSSPSWWPATGCVRTASRPSARIGRRVAMATLNSSPTTRCSPSGAARRNEWEADRMGSQLQVSLIQLGYADGEPVIDRTARAADLVRSAAAGADRAVPQLVVLPELWAPTAFDFRDWEDRAESVDGPIASAMGDLARELGVLLHAGSIVERLDSPGSEGKSLANTSLVFGPDGERVAVYRKIHRFGFGSGEPSLMEAGSELVRLSLPGGRRAGLSTGYDLRFPELYRRLVESGAEVFIGPAAWPSARVEAWSLLGRARAMENQCFVLACNTAGTHAGIEMGGRSQIVSPMGEVLAEAGTGEETLDLTIDLDEVAMAREKFPVLLDRRL